MSRTLANDTKMEGIVRNECDGVGYPPNGISPGDAMSKGLTVHLWKENEVSAVETML